MTRTAVVVDDHDVFRRFALMLLEDAGFTVVGEADSAATGLEQVRSLAPDIVLLDVLLPDGSGLDVAVTLAAQTDPPSVVLVSSRAAEDFGAALRSAPVTAFISKSDLSVARLRAAVG